MKTREIVAEFDNYIDPGPDASWSRMAMEVTGLTPNDTRIKNASLIVPVWTSFTNFISQHIKNDETAILVAWNGVASDIKWLFKLTEVSHRDSCQFPSCIKYFLDPRKVINYFKGCQLNQSKSKILGLGLAEVFCYVTGFSQLEGAHNSLMDCHAQCVVVNDNRFYQYIDKSYSIESINDIWKSKKKAIEKSRDEISRPVPVGWSTEKQRWTPNSTRYEGSTGGGDHGPSSSMKSILTKRCLISLFLFFWSIATLTKIAEATNKYGNVDFVKLVTANGNNNDDDDIADDVDDVDDVDDDDNDQDNDIDDDEGNDNNIPKQNNRRNRFIPCARSDSKARHRYVNDYKSTSFIIYQVSHNI